MNIKDKLQAMELEKVAHLRNYAFKPTFTGINPTALQRLAQRDSALQEMQRRAYTVRRKSGAIA